MPYDALTIDTQTVYANGRHLDRGLVAQLVQFKDGLVQIVLTEIVVRELHKMLTERAKAPLDALAKAIKDGTANGQVSDAQKASLQATLDALASAKDHATRQLQDFVTATGAHIVPAEKTTMKQVLSAYFSKSPPFSTQGKKDEFPDAISLLALEAWAAETNKKVLAVSGDGDWKAFAAQSARIDCMEDLGAAMVLLVQAAESSVAEARNVLACIASADPPELKETLDAALARAVEDETPYAEFDSSMPGEDEGVTLAMLGYTVHGIEDGTTDVEIVRICADGFVMRVPVTVTARAFVDVHFSIRDSIDKDYVPMGATSLERDIEFEAFALIACTRHEAQTDAGATQVAYEIDSAELVGVPQSVELGYIDYSLAGEDDEFDPDKLQTGD